jgi:hypothetical protein
MEWYNKRHLKMEVAVMKRIFITFFILSALIMPAAFCKDTLSDKSDKKIEPKIENLNLILKTEKTNFGVCEPIVINIIVSNNGDERIIYEMKYNHTKFSVYNFPLSVKNDKGEDMPLTEFGMQMKKILTPERSAQGSFGPGQIREYSIIANRHFDMTLNGKYKVRFSGSFYDKTSKSLVTIKSNEIEIEISDKKEQEKEDKNDN